MMPGWLWVDDVEVLNDSRLTANLPCQIGDLHITVADDPCPDLLLDPSTGLDLDIGATANPWYSALYPQSEDFYGFYVSESSLNATMERSTYARAIAKGGSNLGRLRRKHREIAYEVMLVGASDSALRYGYDWLCAMLDPADVCGQSTAMVRLWCPDYYDYQDGLFQLYEVGIIDPPKWGDSPMRRAGCMIRQIDFTLAAGDPWRYAAELSTDIDDDTIPLNEDCAGSGIDSSSTQHDFLCPDELPDQRLTTVIDGPGPIGQNDVNVLIDGTFEGSAAMRIRTRDSGGIYPDPVGTEVLWQNWTGADIPIGTPSVTTDDEIQLEPYSALLVLVWAHVNPEISLLDNFDVPQLSGGGVDNWRSLGAAFPQTSPDSMKGNFLFIGQAGSNPPSEALTVTLDDDTEWTVAVWAHEVTDVWVGEDPRECLRQWVFDKKNADNYGGAGTVGASPVGARSWYPCQIDPTADDNHYVLVLSGHAGVPATVEFNDSDGWAALSSGIHSQTSSNLSFYSIGKSGLAVGENPPMFKWDGTISTAAFAFEFIPRVPDRSHRWYPTVHWIADASITSPGAVGRWPIELTYDLVDQDGLDDMALIYFAESQGNQDWDTSAFTAAPYNFEVVDGTPEFTTAAGSPEDTRIVILWQRPVAGQTSPIFPDSGAHNIVGGMMVKGVKRTGDIMNVVNAAKKVGTTTVSTIPSVTPTADACLILGAAARGSNFASVVYSGGPSNEWSDFVAEGPAVIKQEADPLDVEGGTEDAGLHLNGEIRAGTTAGNGGGLIVISALLERNGESGDFTATLQHTSYEAYVTMAIEGEAETPYDYLSEFVTCRLHTGERLLVDSSRQQVYFDAGDGSWSDGSGMVRTDEGDDPFISVVDSESTVVAIEPANLMGHSDEAVIIVTSRVKVGS